MVPEEHRKLASHIMLDLESNRLTVQITRYLHEKICTMFLILLFVLLCWFLFKFLGSWGKTIFKDP